MHVTSMAVYPVKSTAAIPVQHATVLPTGLEHDRGWMVVDPDGCPVTARTDRQLFTVTAQPQEDGGLRLTAPGREPLAVPVPTAGPEVPVSLSRLPSARLAPQAGPWFSAVLGRPVRLVWHGGPARRPVGPTHGGRPGESLSLADAGPLLLVTEASLEQLTRWIAAGHDRADSVPLVAEPTRFRPNVVVGGELTAFAEDGWGTVRIGDVAFRLGEACDRCVMTTIDPVTLAGGREPLLTLARHRRRDGEVWFGVRLIPEGTGVVAVGDPVTAT